MRRLFVTMRRLFVSMAVVLPLAVAVDAAAEDPFAAGEDALAVKDSDGSASVRARLKLAKVGPDVVLVRVNAVDDSQWPDCVFTGLVLRPATSKARHFKLLGRGKVYRFKPVLQRKRKALDLSDRMTRNNLGACYYPPRTSLEVKVSGVDLKNKAFIAQEVYLK